MRPMMRGLVVPLDFPTTPASDRGRTERATRRPSAPIGPELPPGAARRATASVAHVSPCSIVSLRGILSVYAADMSSDFSRVKFYADNLKSIYTGFRI